MPTMSGVTPYQVFMLSLCAWTLIILGAGSFRGNIASAEDAM